MHRAETRFAVPLLLLLLIATEGCMTLDGGEEPGSWDGSGVGDRADGFAPTADQIRWVDKGVLDVGQALEGEALAHGEVTASIEWQGWFNFDVNVSVPQDFFVEAPVYTIVIPEDSTLEQVEVVTSDIDALEGSDECNTWNSAPRLSLSYRGANPETLWHDTEDGSVVMDVVPGGIYQIMVRATRVEACSTGIEYTIEARQAEDTWSDDFDGE